MPDASRSIAPSSFLPKLSEADFANFQRLIEREVGIFLGPAKKDLLIARLARRLHELNLPSFSAYWNYLVSHAHERTRMIDCICTNETHFFREPVHFEFLEQRVFPEFIARAARGQRPRSIRAWSAGCSTGEEAYSLAMSLLRRFPAGSGWKLSVLATDISTRALSHAMNAGYNPERAAEIPQECRAFTLRDRREGCAGKSMVTFGSNVRELVEFATLNLMSPSYMAVGEFDLLFCRNVMIYFKPETRRLIVDRLLRQLRPDGYLFLGHAESLIGMTDRVRSAGPTIYTHVDSPVPRRR